MELFRGKMIIEKRHFNLVTFLFAVHGITISDKKMILLKGCIR